MHELHGMFHSFMFAYRCSLLFRIFGRSKIKKKTFQIEILNVDIAKRTKAAYRYMMHLECHFFNAYRRNDPFHFTATTVLTAQISINEIGKYRNRSRVLGFYRSLYLLLCAQRTHFVYGNGTVLHNSKLDTCFPLPGIYSSAT